MGCRGAGGPPARRMESGKQAKMPMFSIISRPSGEGESTGEERLWQNRSDDMAKGPVEWKPDKFRPARLELPEDEAGLRGAEAGRGGSAFPGPSGR